MKKTFTFNYYLHSLTNRNKNTGLSSLQSIIDWEEHYPEIVKSLDLLEVDVEDSVVDKILDYAKEYAQKK